MSDFKGFFPETVAFFNSLEKNNTREWFETHKNDYETYVRRPSEDFVLAMGEKLKKIAPDINAIPKVNQSLFRLNRDTRFSHDKSPYKTNLGILFWEGSGNRMESSGFYFHIGEGRLLLGAGMYRFCKDLMEKWRKSVVDKKSGAALQKAISKVSKLGYEIGESHYKRVPAGYDPDHPNAEYLKYIGLAAFWTGDLPEAFYSKEIVDFAFSHFKKMSPIHHWLRDTL
jgi:uncharacterized protein (TIGR02453 family)